MTADFVRLTVVPNDASAEVIRGLLASDGIGSVSRQTDYGAASMDGLRGGETEILVQPSDLERAQELLADR